MALSPSNISPEFQTLDLVNQNCIISWTNNNPVQYGYRIYFYNNADDSLLFDSTLQVSSITSYTLSAGNIANNLEIKYYIKQYIDAINYVNSEYILIKSAIAPQIAIAATPVNTQSFTFIANTTLATNATVQKYKFILSDNLNQIVEDSDWIYGYIPQYLINGLISGYPYKIQAFVYDTNNQLGQSALTSFITSYTSPNPVSIFTVTALDDEGGIQIDFGQINQTQGVVTGTSSYVAGKFGYGLSLEDLSYVEFIKTVPSTFTLTVYVKLDTSFVGDILNLGNNEFRVFYNGTNFGYQFLDYITVGSVRSLPNPSDWIKIALRYNCMLIQTLSYTEIII